MGIRGWRRDKKEFHTSLPWRRRRNKNETNCDYTETIEEMQLIRSRMVRNSLRPFYFGVARLSILALFGISVCVCVCVCVKLRPHTIFLPGETVGFDGKSRPVKFSSWRVKKESAGSAHCDTHTQRERE